MLKVTIKSYAFTWCRIYVAKTFYTDLCLHLNTVKFKYLKEIFMANLMVKDFSSITNFVSEVN